MAAFGLKENIKTFEKIFPNRYGQVTAAGSKYFGFIDGTMNFDLNEKETDGVTTKWLINGVTAKIKMTSGNLAGYEFDLHKYDPATKEIQVVPFTDENGNEFIFETNYSGLLSCVLKEGNYEVKTESTVKNVTVSENEDIIM